MRQELEEGKWYILGRDTIQNSVEYGMDAERIGAIGNVFPLIFFLVAALVSLTTLTLEEIFWMGTKAGGSFFGKVGSFEPGYELDALVLDESRCRRWRWR